MSFEQQQNLGKSQNLWKIFLGLFIGFLITTVIFAILYGLSFQTTTTNPGVKCKGVLCADNITCCKQACSCFNGNCKCDECGDGASCTYNGESGCCQGTKVCSSKGPQCCDADGTNCVDY